MIDRPKKIAFTVGSLLLAIDLWMHGAMRPSMTLLTSAATLSATASALQVVRPETDLHAPQELPRSTRKLAASPQTQPLAMSETEKSLCRISKKTDVPLGGDLRVQSVERVEGGAMYWIKSSDCPAELYSIIGIDRDGRIDKEVNCLRTTLTELTLNSGLQANIEKVPAKKNSRPIAIAGNGRFLVNCPDSGLTLTRDGRFQLRDGALENAEGCLAWTRQDGGRKVVFADGEPLDDRGCSETTRECLDLYEPDERDTEAFNFKTNKSLMILNERGLRKMHSGVLFHGALEDLDTADRSLTGVENWETTRLAHLPAQCP